MAVMQRQRRHSQQPIIQFLLKIYSLCNNQSARIIRALFNAEKYGLLYSEMEEEKKKDTTHG